MMKLWIGIIFIMSFSLGASTHTPYCMALRGNGEKLPAHWGAMAKTVEYWGIPEGMSGASSGSINTFLFESVMMNEALSKSDSLLLKKEVAFLIKSFESYWDVIEETIEYKAIKKIVSMSTESIDKLTAEFDQKMAKKNLSLEDLKSETANYHKSFSIDFSELFDLPLISGMVNPEIIKYGIEDLKEGFERLPDMSWSEAWAFYKKVKYRIGQVKQSIMIAGQFEIEKDDNLFFRPGVLNMPELGRKFGRVANFYAGYNFNRDQKNRFKTIVETCSDDAFGKKWADVQQSCKTDMVKLITEYRTRLIEEEKNPETTWKFRIKEKAGKYFNKVLLATGVLTGESAQKYKKLSHDYLETLHLDFGKRPENNPIVENEDELKFGYWGIKTYLDRVKSAISNEPIFETDPKTQKFHSLGETSWEVVLSNSPAEPGLAKTNLISEEPLQYSNGGWADLYPVQVLKAMGCERVVFVTRGGGDAPFAQGIFKRLLGLAEPSWDYLRSWASNATGNPDDQSSMWSKFYNVANPESSYSLAVDQSDVSICTDWTKYNFFTAGPEAMIANAYQSPMYFSNNTDLQPRRGMSLIHQVDNIWDEITGFPYSGCMPL